MIRKPIVSSNLKTVGYDGYRHILEIEFKSGSIYQYFDVPEEIYKQLFSVSSAGRFFHKYIGNTFRYKLVGSERYYDYYFENKNIIQNPNPNIKELYHKLILRFHPDRSWGNEEIMKAINCFYDERNFKALSEIAQKYNIS